MELISSKQPVARKEHICDFCHGKIKIGEKYEKQTIKHDCIYVWRNHLKCAELYHKLSIGDMDWGYGVDSDTFMEVVYEFIYSMLSEEEHDGLFGEDAVDKAVEILNKENL